VCSLSTWQGASAFNQTLSLDTSSVTNMSSMFYVRLRACPAPTLQLAPPLHAACARTLPHDLPIHPRHLALFVYSLSTWQGAYAFNQPLSLNTSSVTDMSKMFDVRFRTCPTSNLQLAPLLHAACACTLPNNLLRHLLHLVLLVCYLSTWQHASAFNQPLSLNTSSVTDMSKMFDVRFRACPA
jgi:hypothetical protein